MPNNIAELNQFTASRGAAGRAPEDTDLGTGNNLLNQVLDGFTPVSSLTPSKQQEVKSQLFSMGFNSDEPPAWFKDYIQDQKQQTLRPEALQKEWIKYRDGILKGGASGDSSGGEINFEDL